MVTYAAETWVLSKEDENTLRIFERKIIRRKWGPVIENNTLRIRSNSEINKILRGEDFVRYIKSLRLRWMGHIERMENERIPKRLIYIIGVRKRGRPRKGGYKM